MIKTLAPALAIAVGLSLTGAALAQTSGGSDAKGNAPLKHAHTVNDGSAKRGANSFTAKQAQEHIEKSGFTSVTNLAKGDDGVWRGQAMRAGAAVDVAMDFKGNVSTPSASTSTTSAATQTSSRSTSTKSASTNSASERRLHHGHRRQHRASCANPAPNGAACSGIDRNHNGISDKEDNAIKAGAHP